MPDILGKLQQLSEIVKTTKEKQELVNVSEVFYIWDVLATKQDIQHTLRIKANFIHDKDLGYIATQLDKGLQSGINDMEKLMKDYDIPFPDRPPAASATDGTIQNFSDKMIYESIYEGIQAFFPILSSGFMNCTSPKIRQAFRSHLELTMDLQQQIVDYGKLKGYLNQPPAYRI